MAVVAITHCKGAINSNLKSLLRKLKTWQLSHLEPIQEVVLVVIVDGEVVKVTLLLGHVFHCRLTEEKINLRIFIEPRKNKYGLH